MDRRAVCRLRSSVAAFVAGGSTASDDVFKFSIGHGDNIADDLLLEVDAIAPILAAAVLEPEDAGGGVERDVLDIGHPHRPALVGENLLGVVAVADRALVERLLHSVVRRFLAELQGLQKLGIFVLPGVERPLGHVEELGHFAVGGTELRQLAGLLRQPRWRQGDVGCVPRPLVLSAGLFVGDGNGRAADGRMTALLLREQRLTEGGLVAVCAVSIGSAAMTEALGLHFILGAFVAGAVMPDALRQPILDRLQFLTIAVLMPFFFMSTGFKTEINLGSPTFLEIFVVTTVLAVIGKMGGTAVAARLVGEPWSTALSLRALVQTKGLIEVIVLTILLDREIISTSMLSALLMMALVSTALASWFSLESSHRVIASRNSFRRSGARRPLGQSAAHRDNLAGYVRRIF
jgi:hypothetical protein